MAHNSAGFITTARDSWWLIYGKLVLCLIPVADATALSFTVVIFTSLGALLLLNEKIGKHRWFAIFVGRIGTLIILRPRA